MINSKFAITSEIWRDPEMGIIEKKGNKTVFTFQITAPMEDFKSMESAKEAFLEHHQRIQKIVNNYFYFFIRAQLQKHAGKVGVKNKLIEKLLQKLGFIDENRMHDKNGS